VHGVKWHVWKFRKYSSNKPGGFMITVYKSTAFGLEKLDEIENGCWINVIDPTLKEIDQLTALGIEQDFITYPLDLDERPRTEREEDGTTMIIFRIPYYQGEISDIPFTTIPLGIIICENYIITICKKDNLILKDFASGKVRGLSTAKKYRFILRLLLNAASLFLFHLREINKKVDQLEDELQLSLRNRELMAILKYQKSLVYFATALKSNELLMVRLQRSQLFTRYAEDEELLEDVITENQQAIEMTNISNNILSSMMDAFASIISNNLNVVMKFLTSVTIILSIPTVISSFFGMNVDLPFQNIDYAYVIILLICVVLAGIVVFVFMKRDWF
jgi:magnesium transporter